MRISIIAIGLMGWNSFAATPTVKPVADAPTFNKDIAPILYQNCATCHRQGEVAPFSLLTYQDAAKRANLIAAVTAKRYMPPWKTERGYGHFQDERRLTEQQIALIQKWAKTERRKAMRSRSPRRPSSIPGGSRENPILFFRSRKLFRFRRMGPTYFNAS
jgi:mono/diheme cytochrome c family protein